MKNNIDIKKYSVEDIFRPGIRIEVVFNLDSSTPVVRTSTLHDCRFNSEDMVISQTRPQILPSFRYRQMDITTLVSEELNRKFRAGLNCRITKFLKNYKLSDKIREDSILVKYYPPLRKLNIRAAYRVEPSASMKIGGKLLYKEKEYVCNGHYKIHDISLTGIGLLISKKFDKGINNLRNMSVKQKAFIELELIDFNSDGNSVTVSAEILTVRVNTDYNKSNGFVGAKFSSSDPKFEKVLGKFIHEAQLYERRLAAKPNPKK